MRIYGLALLTLALVASPALPEEPISTESVGARYFGAETYCETGKWGTRLQPDHGFTEVTFALCAHRDGRFKYVEHADQPRKIVNWSHSGKYYRYSEYGSIYQEYSLDDPSLPSLYGIRPAGSPLSLSRLFAWDSGRLAGTDPTRSLQSYKASTALSTAQHSVFERFNDEHQRSSERLWVRNKDRSIVRYEGLHDRVVLRFVEIASQEVNRPLTSAELSHDVPLSARYSLQNNPRVFLAGLFVAAGVAGTLVWGWLFARTANVEDVLRKRRRLWRLQLWSFGATAIALAALAALAASVRDSGHPPAIVFVYVVAIWCTVAFALAACFTLTSYPVQLVFRTRRARSDGG